MPRPDLQMKNKNKLKRKLNKTSKNDEEENTLVFTPGLIEEVVLKTYYKFIPSLPLILN